MDGSSRPVTKRLMMKPDNALMHMRRVRFILILALLAAPAFAWARELTVAPAPRWAECSPPKPPRQSRRAAETFTRDVAPLA
jgi:hypothetical protein